MVALNREQIDNIVNDIARGSTIKYAALSNGCARSTFYDYIERGELHLSQGKSDTLEIYLLKRLCQVRQFEIINCRSNIRENERGHKGAEWTLEHAYAEDFSGSAAVNILNEKLDRLLLTKAKDVLDEQAHSEITQQIK